jgi:hypothetical protein
MDISYVPILADAIKAYYGDDKDLIELCELTDLDLHFHLNPIDYSHVKFSKLLITEIEQDNRRRFLEVLIPSLLNRAREGAANSKWDAQDFHRQMVENLLHIEYSLNQGKLPEEVSVSENKPFAAKSEVRDLLSAAKSPITIVDNYIGIGTLDCLRDAKQSIRLLTGDRSNSIASGFDSGLKDFLAEGYQIEVRQHSKLHDRFIIFNDRSWLVGSSLKDAGKKIFNVIECVDVKDSVVSEVEQKWGEATKYTI